MLKIKDNVDIKELEKYGFRILINKAIGNYYFKKAYCNDENDSRLFYTICERTSDMFMKRIIYIDSTGDSRLDNTLYDLIQDGLVEKVEE